MLRKFAFCFACLLSVFLLATLGYSKVSQEEAASLGKDLTPLGAEKAGNKDGTIPAWDGGITKPPAGYKPGMFHPDPYPDDKILFTINAGNVDKYADKLSPGQVALIKRYPDTWCMNVYPTRRSASYPQRIYEATVNNAVVADLIEGGNGVKNATQSVPFPIPKSGLEVIWNHLLRYRGEAVHQIVGQAAPTAGGQYSLVTIDQKVLFPYAQPGATTENIHNRSAYFLQTVTSPPRLAGTLLLVHETLDQVAEPRDAWVYNPGQRRVRKAPNVAYDNPGTASDGQRTSDQLDMFNGAPDRYDWKLIGKKEMYIPYNCYKLHSNTLKFDDILQAGTINPKYVRYELHRVWVIDATLKSGTSHIYGRRTMYLDEDSWMIMVADHYDKRGTIWRLAEAYPINFYEKPLLWTTLDAYYDLQNGRYLVIGLDNEFKNPEDFTIKLTEADFTPSELRREGRR